MRGLTEVESDLVELAARLRNLGPVMEVAGADTVTLIDDSFQTQSSPDGAPWAPLSPTTIALRQKRRGPGPVIPLQDTARLRRSITSNSGPRSFNFGTNVPYAASHQLGAAIRVFSGKRARIPARPFMPVQKSGGRFQLMTSGRAGQHWAAVRTSIERFILTGEVT